MHRILLVAAAAALGGCVPRGAVPAPEPVAAPPSRPTAVVRSPPVTPRPAPAVPAPAATGAMAAWADAPLSPGSWRYRRETGGQSRAQYGLAAAPAFEFACGPGRSVALVRGGASAGPLTVRTTSLARTLQAAATGVGITAQVTANDPLLDAIAFSRGRIAVEAPGTAPLILPAWPELARVIEDCRR